MRRLSNKNIIFVCLLLFSFMLHAQKEKDSVKTEIIEVTRSFTPKVQDAFKLQVNPEAEKVTEKKIPVQYKIQSVPAASTFEPKKGSMVNFSARAQHENAFSSYASLGLGNYSRIKTDAFVFYPVTDELGAAFRLKHHSSQGGKYKDITYNPYYDTNADIIFDYNHENTQWKTDFGFKADVNDLRIFDRIGPYDAAGISKNRANKIISFCVDGNFEEQFIKTISAQYNGYWDNASNTENKFNFFSDFIFPVGDFNLKMGIQADYLKGDINLEHFGNTYTEKNKIYSYFDLGALPSIQVENDRLIMNLGAKIYYQNANFYNNFQFIPNADISYNLIYEKLSVYAGATGNIKQNPYMELTQNNPFLVPETGIRPALTPYDVYGGLNGAFSSSFSYDLKMGFKRIKNRVFYDFAADLYGRYKLIYDNMNQSYLKTALNVGIGKKFDLKLKFNYMQNNPDHFAKAWNVPEYEFGSLLSFHPIETLNVDFELVNVSERSVSQDGVYFRTLPSYTDLNLGINYNINEHFSVFVEGNNLLNKTYGQYFNYPVHAIQVLGGLSYRFDIVNDN